MLIGLLSDAHGNPYGLRACLAGLRQHGATSVYFLGDAVGYMPGEAEVIDILRSQGVICQRGNHEGMLLGDLPLDPDRDRAYGLTAVRARMGDGMAGTLADWPDVRELRLNGRRVLLVHGSPRDHLNEYVYPDSDTGWIADLGYDAVFMGNTHRPFVWQHGDQIVANVGSCGLPRDAGNMAGCALYDTAANTCTVLRVFMDTHAVTRQFSVPVTDLVSECLQRRIADPFGTVVELN